MGWYSGFRSKESLLKELKSVNRFDKPLIIVKQSLIGNNLWTLLKNEEDGNHMIALDMISGKFGTKNNPDWGYKPLTDSCGPFVYNCPKGFLEYKHESIGFSDEWRKKVLEFHEKKKSKTKLLPGMTIEYQGHQFKLLRSLGRKGWRVDHLNGGLYNALTAYQASQSTVIQVA